MTKVVTFYTGDLPATTDADFANFLEDKIAQLVRYALVPTTGIAATLILDADGRMSPLPAGTTVAAGHIRLVDWTTINPGTVHASEDMIQLTVLYLKDAPGKYP